ncbi:MAG: transposase [Gemmataceae bacterium]|nr:transposase [Gemmataceae bacterium]
MARAVVIGYHLIWTGYGWWLPNDPRGSGSTVVRNDVLKDLGELHYGRKRVQPPRATVKQFLSESAPRLMHSRISFDEAARKAIAEAFAETIRTERYTCYACVVMPDHVHILIRKHKHSAEAIMECLRSRSADKLRKTNLSPPGHPVWAGGDGWKVFLDVPDEIRRTIRYIDDNPLPLGLPQQKWAFVTPYDGWPLRPALVR